MSMVGHSVFLNAYRDDNSCAGSRRIVGDLGQHLRLE